MLAPSTACASLRQYVFRRAGCREIRLSGSTRGEWAAPQGVTLSPTLPSWREILYWFAVSENAVAQQIVDAADTVCREWYARSRPYRRRTVFIRPLVRPCWNLSTRRL